MDTVLTQDDPLYEELYDVRREAEEMGNLVEGDMNPLINAARERGGVQQGTLRELIGLPIFKRYQTNKDRPNYSALSFKACEAAFRDSARFSSRIVHHPNPADEQQMGILEMDGRRHLAFRGTLQSMFIKPRTLGWWRQRWIDDIVETLIARLKQKDRAEPGDDVVSKLIEQTVTLPGEDERPLTNREIAVNSRLVMTAGGGTSWRQFGITLWALLTHRDQLEAVKTDRTLIDAAIEESVRWNVTAPLFNRITTEDVELEGVLIPAHSVVDLVTGAANRDPSRWDNPDAYDLHRPLKPHMGFAIGQHQCLGANVARSELSVGINRLLDEFPNLRLDPDQPAPFLTGGLEQRGMSGLPVLLT